MSTTDTPKGHVPDRGIPDSKTPDRTKPVLPRTQETEVEKLQKENKELSDKISSMEEAQKRQTEAIAALTKRLKSMPRMENGKVIVPDCEQLQPHAPQACACGYTFINKRTGKSITRIFDHCAKNYNYQPVRREPEDGAYRTRYNRTDGMHYEQYHSRGDGTGYWTKEGHVVDKASGIPLDSVANIQLAQQMRQDRFDADRAMRAERSRALSQLIHNSHRQGQAMVRRKSEVYNAGLANGVDWSQPRGTPNPEYGGHLDRLAARGTPDYTSSDGRYIVGNSDNLPRRRFNSKTGQYDNVSKKYRNWKSNRSSGSSGDARADAYDPDQKADSWATTFGPTSDPKEQAEMNQISLDKLKGNFNKMHTKFVSYADTFKKDRQFGPDYVKWEQDLQSYIDSKYEKPPRGMDELAFLTQFKNFLETCNKGAQVRKIAGKIEASNRAKNPNGGLPLQLNNFGSSPNLKIIVTPILPEGQPMPRLVYQPNIMEWVDDRISIDQMDKYKISFEHEFSLMTGFREGDEGREKINGIKVQFGKPGRYEVVIDCSQGNKIREEMTVEVDANGMVTKIQKGLAPRSKPKAPREIPPSENNQPFYPRGDQGRVA